jgi:3-dehydroquinate synthase
MRVVKTTEATINVSFNQVSDSYDILIGAENLLENTLGEFCRARVSSQTKKICIISNPKVFRLYGEKTQKSLENAGFTVAHWLMKDGERYKNFATTEKALAFLSAQNLTRDDAIVALGGGVVGDLAGFASAIYLRGIRFFQVPTTLLAQIDSSVGGKTGVNSDFGKNLIGAFHQPRGVLIDLETLKTLPRRELAAGFYEIVKHAALADRNFFAQTQGFLQKFPLQNFKQNFARRSGEEFLSELQKLISANVAFKAQIVAGDERETTVRNDSNSRKILNFGHTVGHALEKVTNYKMLKHGEAVGFGLLAAAQISNSLGKLPKHELDLFNEVLLSVGKLPVLAKISLDEIIAAFAHDKKASVNSFKWILLEKLGRAAIVDDREIPRQLVRDSIRTALKI